MIRTYLVVALAFLLVACGLLSRPVTGFLFPDLKALRIGNGAQSRYKIACLQEDPFLFVNGTGYVPELLRLVGDWYAATRDDNDTFPYDVIPVGTWTQLMTKASTAHWVSYGLVASSLLRYEEPWKSMQVSMATVNTGLKMVISKKVTRTTNSHIANLTEAAFNANNVTTTTADTTYSYTAKNRSDLTLQPPHPESSYHAGGRIDFQGSSIVTLDGSPEEQLLKKSPKYRQFRLKTVQTNAEAMSHLRHNPNLNLLKDSITARNLVKQHESELGTVCPKKSLLAGAQLYYAFFGRDQAIVHFLNGALKKLRTAEYDAIRALNAKYFGHIRICS